MGNINVKELEESTIVIEYDKDRGIFIKFYDEGFFSSEVEITKIAEDCVLEMLLDKNNLHNGGELVIRGGKPVNGNLGAIVKE